MIESLTEYHAANTGVARPHNANHHSMNSSNARYTTHKFFEVYRKRKIELVMRWVKNGNRNQWGNRSSASGNPNLNAIPRQRKPRENTGPGIARTMPYPVNRSCFQFLLHWDFFQPLWGCRPGNVLIEHQWQQYIAAAKYDTAEPVKFSNKLYAFRSGQSAFGRFTQNTGKWQKSLQITRC